MYIKNSVKHILCVTLAALVLACMPFSASAAPPYKTPADLFYSEPYESENKFREEIWENGKLVDENGKEITRDYDVVRRADTSLAIKADIELPLSLQVTIPKGKTLTVEKGATLTIFGCLIIEGTLENKGEIIIGGKSDYDANTSDKNLIFLTNKAIINNSGKIYVNRGTLENKPNAKLTNDGTITVKTTITNHIGFDNISLVKQGKTTYGHVVNNGTINIENTRGIGLRNFSSALIENNGKIYKTKTGSVKGVISGEQVLQK